MIEKKFLHKVVFFYTDFGFNGLCFAWYMVVEQNSYICVSTDILSGPCFVYNERSLDMVASVQSKSTIKSFFLSWMYRISGIIWYPVRNQVGSCIRYKQYPVLSGILYLVLSGALPATTATDFYGI